MAEVTTNKVLEDDINGSKYNYCFVSVSLQVGGSCVTELAECNACSACGYILRRNDCAVEFLKYSTLVHLNTYEYTYMHKTYIPSCMYL